MSVWTADTASTFMICFALPQRRLVRLGPSGFIYFTYASAVSQTSLAMHDCTASTLQCSAGKSKVRYSKLLHRRVPQPQPAHPVTGQRSIVRDYEFFPMLCPFLKLALPALLQRSVLVVPLEQCSKEGREGAAACDIQGSCGSRVVPIVQIWIDLLSASQPDSVIVCLESIHPQL